MDAWTIVLGLGLVLVMTGLLFVAKKIGSEGAVKVGYGKFALENASNAALVFVLGIALVVLGAWNADPDKPAPPATKASSAVEADPDKPATKASSAVEAAPLPAGRLFGDRFEREALDDRWQVISGDWRTADGRLISRGRAADLKTDRAWTLITLDQTLPADYTFRVRTRIIRGNLAEVMVRLSGGRYVRVYLYDIDQDVVLGNGMFIERQAPGELDPEEVEASLGGGESLVEKSFPARIGTWYRLSVTVRGSRYQVSVGGQQLIDFRDRRRQLSRRGTVGLISNGEVEFDDVIIEKA